MNKEQLELDIKDMKAKLAIMEEELEKFKPFEFIYPKCSLYTIDNSEVSLKPYSDITKNIDNGNYRKYKVNAEEALRLTKETKLIGAIAEQVCDDPKKLHWKDNRRSYEIHLDTKTNKYSISPWNNYRTLGVQYMDENTAIKVCEILNNGEVKL